MNGVDFASKSFETIYTSKDSGDDLASITAEDAAYLLASMIVCTYKGAPIACLEVDR